MDPILRRDLQARFQEFEGKGQENVQVISKMHKNMVNIFYKDECNVCG